jgi:hypothetical protein
MISITIIRVCRESGRCEKRGTFNRPHKATYYCKNLQNTVHTSSFSQGNFLFLHETKVFDSTIWKVCYASILS